MSEATQEFTRGTSTERRAGALVQSIARKLSRASVVDENAGLLQVSASRKGLKCQSFVLTDLASLPPKSGILITDTAGNVTKISNENGVLVAKEARSNVSHKGLDTGSVLHVGGHLTVGGAINDGAITDITVVFHSKLYADTTCDNTGNALLLYRQQRKEGAKQRLGLPTGRGVYSRVSILLDDKNYTEQGTTIPVHDALKRGHQVIIQTSSGSKYQVSLEREANSVKYGLVSLTPGKKDYWATISSANDIRDLVIGERFSTSAVTTSPIVSATISPVATAHLAEVFDVTEQTVNIADSLTVGTQLVVVTKSGNKYLLWKSGDNEITSVACRAPEKVTKSDPAELPMNEITIGNRFISPDGTHTTRVEKVYVIKPMPAAAHEEDLSLVTDNRRDVVSFRQRDVNG